MRFLLIILCSIHAGYHGTKALKECVKNKSESGQFITADNAKSEWKMSENRVHFRVEYVRDLNNLEKPKFSLNASLSINFSAAIDITSLGENSVECASLTRADGEFQLKKQDYAGFKKILEEYKGDKKLLNLMYQDFKFKLDFSIPSANLGFVGYNGSCLHLAMSKLHRNPSLKEEEFNCIHLIKIVDLAPNISSEKDVDSLIVRNFINRSLLQFNSSAIVIDSFSLQEFNFSFINLALNNFVEFNTKTLDFSNSNIEFLLNDIFPYFPSLQSLSMENCNLKLIEENALKNLPNLSYLNLGGNALSAIPREPTSLLNLNYLNLSSNTFFMSGSLANLVNLKRLDLSNMIVEDYDFPTAVMQQLEMLNFSKTQIINLVGLYNVQLPNAFPNIRQLYLSESIGSAKYILNYTFPLLEILNLSKNNLTYKAEFDSVFSLFSSLKFLDLSGNNFDRLIEINGVNNDSRSAIFLDLSGNNITGWSESKVRVNNNMNLTLDLSNNKISIVNSIMLDDLSMAKMAFLNNNVFDCRECIVEPFYKYLVHNPVSAYYTCEFPNEKQGLFIIDLKIDPELCVEKVFNYVLTVILPISSVMVVVIVAVVLLIKYKWYVRFFCYLFHHRILSKRKQNDANGDKRSTFDAFVCYSSADSHWVVDQLIPHLEQEEPKLHLCIHDRDFLAGGFILNNIIDCIDISRKTLCLITKSFTQSQWCQYELYLAHNKLFEEGNDGLILILLEDLESEPVPRTLQRLMRTRTYLVWPNSSNEPACKLFWARLRRSIGVCNCLQVQNEFYNDGSYS